MDEILDLLKRTPASSEVFEQLTNIVTITTETLVVDAIETLNINNISSVPVLTPDGKLIGMLDTFDIIGFALEIFPSETDLEEDFFRSFLYSNFQLETRKVKDILNKTYNEEMFTMKSNASVYAVTEFLAHGIHRLPILDENDPKKLVNIVSQTNVIRYILKNIDLCPTLKDASLSDLRMAEKELLTARDSDRMVDVLRLLVGTKFSAILCKDKNGNPSISLSANDVRNLEKDSFASLFLSVYGYYHQMTPRTRRDLITCQTSTTFSEALKLLVDNKIHRLWIKNDDEKVVGVITMTDILERIMFPM